ncbi:BtpA/SgcQ family protein [Halorarius halobius]|uniref:BtpA/SgcQ family protein n=1 Tax=Halorarius halobius TaxID=2962671 RepID=UPI0020CF1ED7|nr:BtpA/SgcQ family protein [Halorarius halobius]
MEFTVAGMVHLPPLPGAPEYGGDRAAIRERARADARALEAGGADAVVVENFGDAPFYPESVPKHVVADMTALVGAVTDAVDVPVGVNVLRNDAEAALSVAAAAGAAFVRVNVHVGARVTDQGIVEGRAHETLRLRERLDADVSILADVAVKHSAPLADRPVEDQARETLERGRADALVVSGPGTGEATDRSVLDRAAPVCATADAPLYVGSGVTADTVADYLAVADGVIVGTALKRGDDPANPVDEGRVRELVAAT